MVEWKVGRKYKWNSGNQIHTCIAFNSKNEPVVEYPSGYVTNIDNFKNENWEEYKEPRKGEFWINIYQDGYICKHFLKESADRASGLGRVACVRVPWTEGEGL